MSLNDANPLVSIILPSRNEGKTIANALSAIFNQDYPSEDIEIFVVDGMSQDSTRKMINSVSALYPHMQILILDNPGLMVPTGMNIALRQAKGEIVIRIDGHCIISQDYVRRCVKHIQRDRVDGVGGSIEPKGETLLAKAIGIGMSSIFGVGDCCFRMLQGKTKLTDTVPFPAYTRQIIERAGFYDEELVKNQDDEYNYRIRKLGGKILLARDIHSTYINRSSWKDLVQQYYKYGLWKVRVLQKHPRQMRLRQFVPPVFVLALLVSFLLAFIPALCSLPPDPYSLSAISLKLSAPFFQLSTIIPALYLIVNLLASIITAFQRGWEYLPFLPPVYAILHVSYGFGFLVGLVKFWNRWGDKQGKTPPFVSQDA